ncbi:MarR family winged helix-turn-helix transcriptional regulator [Glutamicibacter soli]|uniref:MarR family transcriptional regulator n=1 Tax=Glutamicibacter soli TaxID=453836 RepID=A0A365YEY1_9MICC|nr:MULTISPECIES: MarR family transcriptional regulator [Micrococcaceae]ALQ32222.1 MarR family transcriptional regulator [Arthrobacter sp. YC-RL1]KLI89355.1 MarR family transcriptional regulator [Arthrobacter sp. YC-RL1]NAZ16248.1 MarR family transcriptional regulator [Glutamicibacter soli]RBM01251.1 MarR family transcriptional regulator [Glutamicibacter soli]
MNLQDEELLQLEKQVCFGLAVASRTVISAYKPVLDPMGLTHPQYLVMLALWEFAPMSARELSDQLHLDPGTLSPLLKRLETAGLIVKTRNPQDERAIVITTTEQGAALRTEAVKVPKEMMKRLNLSLEDAVELRTILDRMIAAGSAAPKG